MLHGLLTFHSVAISAGFVEDFVGGRVPFEELRAGGSVSDQVSIVSMTAATLARPPEAQAPALSSVAGGLQQVEPCAMGGVKCRCQQAGRACDSRWPTARTRVGRSAADRSISLKNAGASAAA
jgi:hypothetical protein